MEVRKDYKQTEVGVIPKDWKIFSGEQITTLISKGASPRWQGFEYSNSGMLFVTSENVRDGYLDITAPKYLPLEFHEKLKRTKLQKHDILINLVGASIGRSCQIREEIGEANVNQAVAVFRVNNQYSSSFIAFYFQEPLTVKRILDMQVDAARQNISLGNLRGFLIPVPPTLAEQEAIAETLSDADALIESLETLLAKKRQVKQGAMSELLTGKRRVVENGEWEVKRLGDECELITKGTTPTSIGKDFTSSGIKFIKIESLTEDGEIIDDKVAFIDEETHKLLKRSQLREGDLLISIAGALGRTGIVEKNLLPANTNQALAIARLKSNAQLNLAYIYQYLKLEVIKKHIEGISVQGAQANLSLQNIADLPIYAPNLPEQTAIAEILSDMDAEIRAVEGKLVKARAVKAGMMSALLTGRVRLV